MTQVLTLILYKKIFYMYMVEKLFYFNTITPALFGNFINGQ